MTNQDFFAHLDDDLSEALNAPKEVKDTTPAQDGVHIEKCPSCRGTGKFISYTGRVVGQCFKCKGKGSKAFKQSKETRMKQRAQRKTAKRLQEERNVLAFSEAHPEVWSWMSQEAGNFDFADSLVTSVKRFGELTEKQLAAAQRCVDRKKNTAAEKQAREAKAPTVDMTKVEEAFGVAAQNLKHPKLRFESFQISMAGPNSRNPGALYVTADGYGSTYFGKIQDGRFFKSRECQDEMEQKILGTLNDPKAAAVAYGVQTGSCSCCGRELTNPDSVAAGIGPICAGNFGW